MRLFALLFSVPLALWPVPSQKSSAPSALTVNQDSPVANNHAETTLSRAIDASTLMIMVTSGGVFTPPLVVRIDNEAILICSESRNVLTVCPAGRGFDGARATNHGNTHHVQERIFGWRHSQLAAEAMAVANSVGQHPVIVRENGARCDGATDDTTAIQTALTQGGHIVFPPGVCIVNPLTVASNSYLEFHPLTVLKSKTGYHDDPGAQHVLNIVKATNVTIAGNGATVQMLKSEYTTGEQRHGVFIAGSTDVRIYDLRSIDSGGDGFFIGATYGREFSLRVAVYNCVADNNRRQGLSIVSGKNVLIAGGEYRNTSGTAPQSGIDLEPDTGEHKLESIYLLGVKTSGNAGSGLLIVPVKLGSAAGNAVSITVDGLVSRGDSVATPGGSIRMVNGSEPASPIGGSISISNSTILNPREWGVAIEHWGTNLPRAVLRKVVVVNPNSAGTGVSDFGWSAAENTIATASGFVVAIIAGAPTTYTQQIVFDRCRVEGVARVGFYLHSSTAAKGVNAILRAPAAPDAAIPVDFNVGKGKSYTLRHFARRSGPAKPRRRPAHPISAGGAS
jgi:hypothetical protein